MDYWQDLSDEAETAIIKKGISDRQLDQIAYVLGTFGDAVQARVDASMAEAKLHMSASQHKAAIVASVTAVELIIRHIILRPIVEGAFLSEEWIQKLTKEILPSASGTHRDRDLLFKVLSAWSINLNTIQITNGRLLWETFKKIVVNKRNNIVHKGEPAQAEEASLAIECAEAFLKEIVAPLSDKFGFSWSVTNCWGKTTQGQGGARVSALFNSKSPFV